MPVHNRIADYAQEMTEWRRHLHRHPELRFDCFETARFVVERLRDFGVDEVHEGIAQSGVVAIIEGQGAGPVIGLRADMDALPIAETTGAAHASTVPGVMHACGHDGHTTMLLGAARYLAETRRFAGRVALIFQPAEEGAGGARVMVEEGILDRFGIERVFALHNAPGVSEGSFVTRPGPFMAAVDTATVRIAGRGGHGARPHETADPIQAAIAMIQAFQTIVSRNVPAGDAVVISVTQIHAGSADNIIPDASWFGATIRSFDDRVRDLVERRMGEIVAGQAAAFGVQAELDYARGYPPTVNDAEEAAVAVEVAREVAGAGMVEDAAAREFISEDFAYMLAARPGAYLFLGQGESAGLHQSGYDFNDAVAPVGASFLARVVERGQPAG